MDITKQIILLGLTGVVGAFISGVVIGYNQSQSLLVSDPKSPTMHSEMSHAHERRDVPEPYPGVAMQIIPDTKEGWNIFLELENFQFAPEKVNTEYRNGEGHAHLYINGERKTRLYAPQYFLKELPPGNNIITVTLSGNDHSELYADDNMIAVSETVVVE